MAGCWTGWSGWGLWDSGSLLRIGGDVLANWVRMVRVAKMGATSRAGRQPYEGGRPGTISRKVHPSGVEHWCSDPAWQRMYVPGPQARRSSTNVPDRM